MCCRKGRISKGWVEDLVNYIDVGLTYYSTKNMNAFVDYKSTS
jgi:predicted porin